MLLIYQIKVGLCLIAFYLLWKLLLSREEYRGGSLTNVVNKFFGKSYLSAVSALVKSEKVSIDDLKELIREVEENNQQ